MAIDASRAGRAALTGFLALYGFSLLKNPGQGSLIDGLDLPIHETGHLVFAPFGEFVGFLGGTLFQLIVPCVFLGYFLKRGDRHAATVMLWWVGQNFWNISPYVADARSMDLPLVGGGEHDWNYLLGELGWLPRDQVIARRIWVVGVFLYIISIVGGLLSLANARSGEGSASEESAGAIS